jgi:hypothetical protein
MTRTRVTDLSALGTFSCMTDWTNQKCVSLAEVAVLRLLVPGSFFR